MGFVAIRQALSDALEASGLRCYPTVQEKVEPPCAWIVPDDPVADYREAFDLGTTCFHVKIRLLVARVDVRSAQNQMDDFIDSMPGTLNGNLGGLVADVNVSQVGAYGAYPVGDISYLGCEFLADVWAA